MLMHALAAFLDPFICSIGSVVKGTEPFVPRHFQSAIVTFKKSMMELMMKITSVNSIVVLYQYLLEPGMRKTGANCFRIEVPQHENRVGWDYKMQK
jgi:hypothetical protein